MVPGGGRILSNFTNGLRHGGTQKNDTGIQQVTRPRVPLGLADNSPDPYSEEADHLRRDREDPQRGARGIIRWTLAAMGLALLIGLGFCAAQGQQFFIRYEGDQNRVDIQQSTGGGYFNALMQFNAWAANDTRVRITGPCASACTLLLSYDNVCWTRGARFHVHAAQTGGAEDREANRSLAATLPPALLEHLPDPDEWSTDYERGFSFSGAEVSEILQKPLC